MSLAALLAISLLAELAASDECVADLEVKTMEGPNGCTPQGAEEIENEMMRTVIQCFHECAKGYTLRWDEAKGPTAALAIPTTSVCSKMPELLCSPVDLTCAKDFSSFPNACSGVVVLAEADFFVAFYAYSQKSDSGKLEAVLATRVVTDAQTVCKGEFKVDQGKCLGINSGTEPTGDAVAPPLPPKQDNMPAPFPAIKPGGDEPEVETTYATTSATTSTTAAETTETTAGETTEAPTETTEAPTEPTEAPTEPTEAPAETTEAPAEPTEAPENPDAPENPKRSGWGVLPWFLLLLILVVIAFAVYYVRRKRRLEEQRLRDNREVYISR